MSTRPTRRHEGIDLDNPGRKSDERESDPSKRILLACKVLMATLHKPKGTEALWERLARHPQRFSLAEFTEALEMLKGQQKISCTNRVWWNREKTRRFLMKPPGV